MKYRTDLLFAAQDLGASGTKVIDLDYKKPISRIEMTYKTTRGAVTMSKAAPANIPKIELVDGAVPLHSLTGYTNQALAYYNRGGKSMEHGQHIMSVSEIDTYAIDFGRFLHDPLLAFDPTRFANPQLKIQYNEALADTSASAGTLEIWAEMFDEKVVSPMGFLSAREIWYGNFLAENSVNEVEIPSDEIIRQILVRANYEGYEPWYQVDIAKMDEGGNGNVIFDYTDLEMFYRRMKSRWPLIVTPLFTHAYATASYVFVPQSDYYATVGLHATDRTSEYYLSATRGGKIGIVASVDTNCVGVARGYLPWHTFQFPLGAQNDPDDWYDPTNKRPRLRLTSNSAGVSGDGNVVIETIHKY